MIQISEEQEIYRAHFSFIQKQANQHQPSWITAVREAAMESFSRLGFPGTQDEEWRFTNIAPLTRIPFDLPTTQPDAQSISGTLSEHGFDWPGIRLVFINGIFNSSLSSLADLPRGVKATGFASAVESDFSLLEQHLARYVDVTKEAFCALNTAFLSDGALIYIPEGIALERPIHLMFLSAPGRKPSVSHPRTLVVAGANSQLQIVESYLGLGSETYFTNAVTEVVAGENAFVDHYRLQRENLDSFHISTVQVQVNRNANVSTQSISMGGALVRNHVNAVLNGTGGEATLNGFYLANGKQHVDNHTSIDHAKPHCSSHELYKGILDGQSRGVFNGRIIVRPDAQKTDSKQTNKNLILSEEALVNTNPQLEIYADDVKCTHGATIGQLDSDAIFYMRSRGIDLDSARHLLTYAFAGDSLSRVKIEPLRRELERILFARLAEGREEKS
jgi:Fe-S cluster assembly protein SufD